MAVRMQQRRATAEQWLLADPILDAGEIGIETDTVSFKIGDGVNNWSLLDYFETSTTLQGTIDDYIPLTQKGAALGVAELDANGFVPSSQLDIDLTAYYTSSETDSAISTAVSNLVDSAPGVLDTLNELAAAIGDDANFVTTINATIASGDSTTLASAQAYADTAEADAITAANTYTDGRETAITGAYQAYADQAETDAVASAATYTDGEISTLDTSLKAYADQAEADAISTAATDATTKANTAESNANSYTDNLVGDPTVDGTAGNTVKDRIDTAVSNLVDTAPTTLDTLNELAAALNDDPNFATTIATQISGKADASHTHTLADVTDVTATATELNYVSGVTSGLQAQIDAIPSGTRTLLQEINITTSVSQLDFNPIPTGYDELVIWGTRWGKNTGASFSLYVNELSPADSYAISWQSPITNYNNYNANAVELKFIRANDNESTIVNAQSFGSDGQGISVFLDGAYAFATTSPITRIRFALGQGSITAGNIKLYGIKY